MSERAGRRRADRGRTDDGPHPPYLYPDYRSTVLRAPREPLAAPARARSSELDRAGLRRRTRRRARRRPHRASTRASRSASGSSSPAACSTATAGRSRGDAGRDLAGQRRRPLPPRRRPAPGAARPELHRRRPLPDRRRRPLPLRHDQARRLPVAEPPQRLAARAHPLLAVRPRVHRPARDADVLPRRSAVRARPDLPVRARPGGARAARLRASTGRRPTPEWALGYRFDIVARRPRRDADGGLSWWPSRRRRRPSGRSSRSACAEPQTRARARAARRARSRSRPGARRRGRAGARRDGRDLAGRRRRQLPAGLRLGPLRHRRRRRATRSSPSSRAACRRRGRPQAPHLDVLGLRPRPAEAGADPRSTSPTRTANAADPVLAALGRARARRRSSRAPERRRLRVRHPPAGRRADDVLRAVTAFDGHLRARRRSGEAVVRRAPGSQAMLDAERALAAAEAHGRRDPGGRRRARSPQRCRRRAASTPTRSPRQGRAAGNPVEPLVRALRERGRRRGGRLRPLGRDQPGHPRHRRDARRAARARRSSLGELDGVAAALRGARRASTARRPMAGADAAAAGGADHVRAEGGRLARRRWSRRGARLARGPRDRLAVQLGGAAGTLARARRRGARGRCACSRTSSSSPSPLLPWHTDRARIAELGAALGVAAGAARQDRGATSSCSRRPRSARCAEAPGPAARRRCRTSATRSARALAVACARQVAGATRPCSRRWSSGARARGRRLARRVATRSRARSRFAGGAAAAARGALDGLEVDAERMRANLDATGGARHGRAGRRSCSRERLGRQAAHELVAAAAGAGERALVADELARRSGVGALGATSSTRPRPDRLPGRGRARSSIAPSQRYREEAAVS